MGRFNHQPANHEIRIPIKQPVSQWKVSDPVFSRGFTSLFVLGLQIISEKGILTPMQIKTFT